MNMVNQLRFPPKKNAVLFLIVSLWFLIVLPMVGFFLLRGDPQARSLDWIPEEVGQWLDSHWDLRTLIMALGASSVPAFLFVRNSLLRRLVLAVLLLCLLLGELAQVWLPLRTFSWIDIGFSVLGVAVAELLVVLVKVAGSRLQGEGFRGQDSGGRNQESGNPSAGFSPQQLAMTAEKLTPNSCPLTPSSPSHSKHMKVLIYGLNYAPELTGVGRYTGEMGPWLLKRGVDVRVVTTPPYYPHWKIAEDYRKFWFQKEEVEGVPVCRCPFYVPAQPTTIKRLIHLGSFAVTGFMGLWRHLLWRPDWVFMVEPASITVPGGLIFAKVAGAKTWLHVQDFEMEAMLGLSAELGKKGAGVEVAGDRGQEAGSEESGGRGREAVDESAVKEGGSGLKGKVLGVAAGLEAWLKRRFDRTSSISQVMMGKLAERGVRGRPNFVFPKLGRYRFHVSRKTGSGIFGGSGGLGRMSVLFFILGTWGESRVWRWSWKWQSGFRKEENFRRQVAEVRGRGRRGQEPGFRSQGRGKRSRESGYKSQGRGRSSQETGFRNQKKLPPATCQRPL